MKLNYAFVLHVISKLKYYVIYVGARQWTSTGALAASLC